MTSSVNKYKNKQIKTMTYFVLIGVIKDRITKYFNEKL